MTKPLVLAICLEPWTWNPVTPCGCNWNAWCWKIDQFPKGDDWCEHCLECMACGAVWTMSEQARG